MRLFARFAAALALSGRPCAARAWMRLRKPRAFNVASFAAER
jgi:hypothetical protein